MARKSKLLEDDFSDSGASDSEEDGDNALADLSGDERDEARRVMNKRKRKRNGRDAATYGVWAPEADEPLPKKFHKTPSFVPSAAAQANGTIDADEIDNLAPMQEDVDMEESQEGSSESDDEPEEAMPPPETEPEPLRAAMDVQAGLGSARRGGIGSSGASAGLGSMARAGLGARPAPEEPPARQPRSFVGQPTKSNQNSPRPATPLTAEEKRHFAQLEKKGGIGFQLLSKMGWKAGTGLGTEQEGRINPVDQLKRPTGMGLGHGGFKERTKQSVLEARRRGDHVSSDEDERAAAKKQKNKLLKQAARAERDEAWKASPSTRARRTKVEHKTYEEILREAAEAGQAVESGIGQLIDISGAELPSLASSLSLNVPVPTSDTERLPELRHNLRLIVESTKGELTALAREGKAVQEKRKWIGGQERKAVAALHTETQRIQRLQEITNLVQDISARSRQASSPSELFQLIELQVEQLASNFTKEEFATYQLDQVAVAAIAPMMRTAWMEWDPLSDPAFCAKELRKWSHVLKPQEVVDVDDMALDVFGQVAARPQRSAEMTPYEALMWTYWLPKIRSAINNSWHPSNPQPAMALYATWSSILPTFIRDNILDQLILPKVRTAMSDWAPRTSDYSLESVVFPWLQYAGPRMEEILQEAKRRLKAWLKAWKPRDGVPQGLDIWRSVHESGEWDTLMLKTILPHLGTLLRDKLLINPRQQVMEPLEKALAWRPFLKPNMLDQLLELEFFPKWLNALYTWLTAASTNYDQVGQWYSWWKNWFDPEVAALPGVKNGFGKGLQLMNDALELGDDARHRLSRPVLTPVERSPVSTPGAPKAVTKAEVKRKHQLATETTFRSIVEDLAAQNNLIFMHTGRSHEITGQPLFRISRTVDDKKGGIVVYLLDDVVWAQEGQSWVPVSVTELVNRAQKA